MKRFMFYSPVVFAFSAGGMLTLSFALAANGHPFLLVLATGVLQSIVAFSCQRKIQKHYDP